MAKRLRMVRMERKHDSLSASSSNEYDDCDFIREYSNMHGDECATEEDDVMLITDKGTIIRINVKDVSILGRSTQGVTLMRTNDGGKVVSIETLTPDIENE